MGCNQSTDLSLIQGYDQLSEFIDAEVKKIKEEYFHSTSMGELPILDESESNVPKFMILADLVVQLMKISEIARNREKDKNLTTCKDMIQQLLRSAQSSDLNQYKQDRSVLFSMLNNCGEVHISQAKVIKDSAQVIQSTSLKEDDKANSTATESESKPRISVFKKKNPYKSMNASAEETVMSKVSSFKEEIEANANDQSKIRIEFTKHISESFSLEGQQPQKVAARISEDFQSNSDLMKQVELTNENFKLKAKIREQKKKIDNYKSKLKLGEDID